MATVLNIHQAEFEVLPARSQQGHPIKVLAIIDPATGIQVHVPMPAAHAEKLGKALVGTNVEIATAMPAASPPSPRRG